MAMYKEASEVQHASASAEEAGKAAVQLSHLCDSLLKVWILHLLQLTRMRSVLLLSAT